MEKGRCQEVPSPHGAGHGTARDAGARGGGASSGPPFWVLLRVTPARGSLTWPRAFICSGWGVVPGGPRPPPPPRAPPELRGAAGPLQPAPGPWWHRGSHRCRAGEALSQPGSPRCQPPPNPPPHPPPGANPPTAPARSPCRPPVSPRYASPACAPAFSCSARQILPQPRMQLPPVPGMKPPSSWDAIPWIPECNPLVPGMQPPQFP